MNTARGLALAALAAVLVLGAWLASGGDTSAPVTSAARTDRPDARGGAAEPSAARTDERVDAPNSAEAVRTDAGGAQTDAEVAPEPDEPAGTIAGSVRGENKKPIAGAEIALVLLRGGEPVARSTTRSDERGRFTTVMPEFAALDPVARVVASIRAVARRDGFLPESQEFHVSDAHNRALFVDLTLLDGATARGIAVDVDGRPAVGALVGTALVSRWPAMPFVCDAEGRFEVERSSSRDFVTVNDSRLQATNLVTITDPVRGFGSFVLDPCDDATVLDVGTIVLQPLGVIAGRVLDERGAPVAGLTLSISIQRHDTALDGRTRELIDWMVEHDGTLSFSGGPVPPMRGLNYAVLRTGSDGSFRCAGLLDGEYTVSSESAPDQVPVRSDARRLASRDGRVSFPTGSLGLELVLAGAWIEVTTIDGEGRALAEIPVTIRRASDVEGAARSLVTRGPDAIGGTFVESGARFVVAEDSRELWCTPVEVETASDGGVTRVVLRIGPPPATGRMRVNLTDELDRPCKDYEVVLREHGLEAARYAWHQTLDDDGSPELPAGAYQVEILPFVKRDTFRPEYLPIDAGTIVIGAQAVQELSFALERGAHVRLTVRTRDGGERQVSGSIEVVDRRGRALQPSVSGRGWHGSPQRNVVPLNEAFDLLAVFEPGTITLRVEVDGLASVERTLSIGAGEPNDVVIDS